MTPGCRLSLHKTSPTASPDSEKALSAVTELMQEGQLALEAALHLELRVAEWPQLLLF